MGAGVFPKGDIAFGHACGCSVAAVLQTAAFVLEDRVAYAALLDGSFDTSRREMLMPSS